MKTETCCFTGHRNLSQKDINEIKEHLKNEIVKLIHQGVIYFGAGGALGFDTICAMTILELRKVYPQIKLILVLPCSEQSIMWNISDKQKYEYIKSRADKVRILSPYYYDGCMLVRNRYLVDNSHYCICHITKSTGGTAYTVAYAEKMGLKIIKI